LPFVTVCVASPARKKPGSGDTNRANPLRGTGAQVKRMLGRCT